MRSFPIIGVAILSLWLAACSFDTDDAAPMVTETAPEDGAADVATDTDITVTFSEALLGETLSTESMIVTLDGEPVPGTLSYDDMSNSLVFTPESPWIKTLEYTVTLDPEITDLARNRLGDYSFSFTVRDGEWGEAAVLSDGAGDANDPVIAAAPDGTAIAAWVQNDGANNVVNAAHYAPDFGGWGFPGPIDIYELGNARTPHISTGGNGHTFVIWAEEDGPDPSVTDPNNYSIWGIRYTLAGGWEAPQQIEPWGVGSEEASAPKIAVDGEGNAIAVWVQENGGTGFTDIWYNVFSVDDLAWQGETLLEMDDAGDATSPHIAMNDGGEAIVVWSQEDSGGIASGYAVRYLPGDGWQDIEEVDSDSGNTNHAIASQAAINDVGDAMVGWTLVDDPASISFSSYEGRLLNGDSGEWSDPVNFSVSGELAIGSGLEMNSQGRAIALWSRIDAAFEFIDIYARYYTPTDGWSAPAGIETDPDRASLSSSLALDRFGNALLTWMLIDGGRSDLGVDAITNIQASRYLVSEGAWSEPEDIENMEGLAITTGTVSDYQGNGVSVWRQQNDSDVWTIQTNIFQ